jgi:hypothetical protein
MGFWSEEADEVSPLYTVRNTAALATRTPLLLSPDNSFSSFLHLHLHRSTFNLVCRTMLTSRTAARLGCWRGARLPRVRYLHDLHKHPQSRFLQVSEEVRDAVATGKPVVALETTIYTHGMS